MAMTIAPLEGRWVGDGGPPATDFPSDAFWIAVARGVAPRGIMAGWWGPRGMEWTAWRGMACWQLTHRTRWLSPLSNHHGVAACARC